MDCKCKLNRVARFEINPDGYYPQCSNCGYEPIVKKAEDLNQYKYCPNCGYSMEEFKLCHCNHCDCDGDK